jgi:hypothetical protein
LQRTGLSNFFVYITECIRHSNFHITYVFVVLPVYSHIKIINIHSGIRILYALIVITLAFSPKLSLSAIYFESSDKSNVLHTGPR